jgi:hypothetical protein
MLFSVQLEFPQKKQNYIQLSVCSAVQLGREQGDH